MQAMSTGKAGLLPAAAPTSGREGRLVALAAAFAVALCAFVAAPSHAAEIAGFQRVGAFALHGADGVRVHHQRIAVEALTGNVLETDTVNDRINVYRPDATGASLLTSFGTGDLTDPFGIAIDEATGAVYVTDAGRNRVVRYTRGAGDPPTYVMDGAFTSPVQGAAADQIGSFAAAIAIDPTAQKLLVADPGNNRVKRFNLDGSYDNLSFDGAGSGSAFTGLLDLAIDSAGDVIVVDSTGDIATGIGASRVLRFDATGAYESQIGASLFRPATVAVRPGGDEVVVSGNQDSVNRDEKPTVDLFTPQGVFRAHVEVPDVANYSVIAGMAFAVDGRMYVATDVDRTILYGGAWGLRSIQAYSSLFPSAPTVEPPPATTSDLGTTAATFNATITPNLAATTYYFEYGTSPGVYSARTPVAAVPGEGSAPQNVNAAVTGLEPATTYYFRVVADNGVGGPVAGSERTFTTVPLPASIVIGPTTEVTRGSASLHATIDAQRAVGGFYRFSVVEVGGPGSQSLPKVVVPAGVGPVAVSANVGGLEPGRTYRVGLYVDNPGGVSYATPVTFTTPGKPPYDPPPRQPDSVSPYGCAAPKLDPVGGRPRRGQTVTLTGADLGVYGTVAFGGRDADVLTWAANRVTVAVPDDARGRVTLRLDCGNAVETAVTIGELPSNSITVGDPVVKRRVATLRVKVPGKGVLTARGRYLRGSSKRPARSGTTTLRVRLTRAGGRVLSRARGGELRVTVVVRFKPDGGPARTVRLPVFFES